MTVKQTSNLLIQERIEELRENTDFVSTLLESLVGYAIIAADFDGNIIAYNEGARQIYGYAPEEVIGKQGVEIFFPREFIEAGKLQEITDGLIEKGRFSYEGEKVRNSGEVFPAQILFTLTRDKSGKVVGFIEIVEDLTERKKVEEANLRQLEQELKSLARLSPPQRTSATAQAFGLQPLEQSSPDLFKQLVCRYGDLTELALEQRAFKVQHDITGKLQDIAEELALFFKAGPRDVVEIHVAALRNKTGSAVNNARAQAYIEEARVMVLQLMGHLVSQYRTYFIGTAAVKTRSKPARGKVEGINEIEYCANKGG